MLVHLLIAIYPILLFILILLLFKFFKIRQFSSINVPDIVTFFLILGLHLFSRQITHISILPYFLMLMSIIALVLLSLDLFYNRHFEAKHFLHFFWRITFFVTLLLYILMVVIIFQT
ncbi:DUF3397 family protein [Lactococcus paracarnosus]|uniref:DUF3397 family protein n=1 Tax=Pseudolactococcus paracarnosus TaxID=2749962 RepID=A0ABT0AMV2_9LACT|nr:DUF3397 family protein [Lactococcus paracarnosus]SPC37294.1 conserved membrane hypothetical protein [Lactococcus piscium]MCJ1977812.1 DUF3397 family protein [Lactococcus paracarnosus]MCJ1983875.1 DUF3397 family protein [Lactococcus paracarnosus]MCJ1993318.1 DUF3397 family protein [Lactococcus paracarnosus]MCJ1999136.1 DUF3397 family protein [Lactococcus paracarnosus]